MTTSSSAVRARRARRLWTPLFATVAALFIFSVPAGASTLAIHVRGNQLVDGQQRPIRLLGVNFSGAEYACIQNRGIWSAPADQVAIEAMLAWHINVVRIPLNEDCWLGIDGAPEAYSGTVYRQAIHEFVSALHAVGIYAILDLQWSAPGEDQANGLQDMADLDHSPQFWSSVAQSFREDPAVLFDLYSEPHEIGWECWLEGCTLPWPAGGTWQSAGMQTLVDAVRSQGATQPLLLGGIEWANDLSGWLAHLPKDPNDQLVASVHVYANNACASAGCWSETLQPITERYPVVAGEIGEFDCQDHFIDQFMNWADASNVSYLGWTWNTFDCSSGPALISDPDGAPTAFGQGLRDRLRTARISLSAPSPVSAEAPIQLTAQVTSPTESSVPGGDVSFQLDGQSLASVPLGETGQATFTLPRLSVGSHRVHVLYGGEANLEAGVSQTQTIEILALPTPAPIPAPRVSPTPLAPPPVSPFAPITSTSDKTKLTSSVHKSTRKPTKRAQRSCSQANKARAKRGGIHGQSVKQRARRSARCTAAKKSKRRAKTHVVSPVRNHIHRPVTSSPRA